MSKAGQYLPMSGYEKSVPAGLMGYHGQNHLQNQDSYEDFSQHSFSNDFIFQAAMPDNVDQDYHYITSQLAPAHVITTKAVPRVNQTSIVPSTTPANTEVASTPAPRKRKASVDSDFELAHAQKKTAVAQVQVQDINGDYYDYSGQTSPYSPFVPTPTGSAIFPAYHTQETSPKPSGHHYSVSNASAASIPAHSPHTPAFSPSYTTIKTEHSPRVPVTPLPRPASATSAAKAAHPKLVRTSTIQQSPPIVQTPMGMNMPVQSFNPYAMYPLKANLKLNGDLDQMAVGWSQEEKDCRRRLVEFKRSQNGNTINAEFKPVTPQERNTSIPTISCILWKEKNECYVTSVDTIHLLETLIGARFTVEEKNRIRRNLEGFRPATVSKSKQDSEEFFKVIMGFPSPRPRNIEKDVKVFPWKILSTALRKIIGKYSASYSSTAGTLLTLDTSNFNDDLAEFHYPMSPRHSVAMPSQMHYPVNNSAMYGPGPAVPRVPMPVASGLPPQHMAVQMQHMPQMPQYQEYPQYYSYQPMQDMSRAQMPMSTHAMSAPPMSAPVMRMQPQWDYSQFVYETPSSMAPASAPPSAYPRGSIETADFVTPSNYHGR